jgi:hypothetical protein
VFAGVVLGKGLICTLVNSIVMKKVSGKQIFVNVANNSPEEKLLNNIFSSLLSEYRFFARQVLLESPFAEEYREHSHRGLLMTGLARNCEVPYVLLSEYTVRDRKDHSLGHADLSIYDTDDKVMYFFETKHGNTTEEKFNRPDEKRTKKYLTTLLNESISKYCDNEAEKKFRKRFKKTYFIVMHFDHYNRNDSSDSFDWDEKAPGYFCFKYTYKEEREKNPKYNTMVVYGAVKKLRAKL